VRARREARAEHRRPRARGLGHRRPVVQHHDGRPPGHVGRVQGPALRRRRRARVRLLRHRAAVPRQRAERQQQRHRGRGPRHVRPGQARADRDADDAGDALAARVAEPQPGARAARRRQRQPGDVSGLRRHLRRPQRLPPSGARLRRPARAARPRERLLGRRQDLLRHRHVDQVGDGDRRQRPQGAARRRADPGPLARDVAVERRQPCLHRRRHRRQHADPRHQPDPGAQAQPAGHRDQPPHLAARVDPPERDPVHRERPSLRPGVRRVHRRPDQRGQRRRRRCRARHRHRRREVAAGRREPAPGDQQPRGAPQVRRRSRRLRAGEGLRPGLRGALLQHPDARRPQARGLLVHRVRSAALRHQRHHQAQGDRLLRRADEGQVREQLLAERLRHVDAGVRARPPRDLVDRRHERLLRAARGRPRVERGDAGVVEPGHLRRQAALRHPPAGCGPDGSYVDGKRVAVRRAGLRLRAIVDLRKLAKKTVSVRIVGRTKGGRAFHQTRRYHTCRPGS
jgi:hypothetical protein